MQQMADEGISDDPYDDISRGCDATLRIGFGAMPDGSPKTAVDLIRLAEALGCDSARVLGQTFHRDPFTMLGHISAGTNHIQLVPGVTSAITRHPAK